MLGRLATTSKAAGTLRAAASRPSTITAGSIRGFRSPFPALSSSQPLTGPHAHTTPAPTMVRYEKAEEHSPDPEMSVTGTRTYVVSQPDPSNTPYEVPSGAFATSAPYHGYPAAESAPGEVPKSSSSASPAHPATTRRVPINQSGVGESASVRYRSAPGDMGKRGGGNYGVDLMDKNTTKAGPDGELAERNPPPLSPESEEFSKKGLKDAWKARK